jgi:predicted O-methyltransferase YrrM
MPVSPSDYKLKVLVGLPFAGGSRYVPPEWALALATTAWPMNCRYAYYPLKGIVRETARTDIIDQALSKRAQYVAMLDDDVQPPSDWIQAFTRELDSRPEYDVICAIVPSMAGEPMIFAQPEMGPHWRWKRGDIFEIAECATACIMFRTDLFRSLPKPWFRDLNTIEERIDAGTITKGEADRGAMTDDIYFCRKATAAGHRILAHGGVLPIHWNRKGEFAGLPADSYPFQPSLPNGDTSGLKIEEALLIPGWMSAAELLWLAEHAQRAKEILEVGSYCGRSTRALAENTRGRVTAVDIWLPTDETESASDKVFSRLPDVGEDWLWNDFRTHMLGLTNVHALRAQSVDAAAQVPDSVRFDMIFIDANHRYEDVRDDILAWRPKLTPGGLLCGHDYDKDAPDGKGWQGVVRAVDELVPNVRRGAGSIWYAPID